MQKNQSDVINRFTKIAIEFEILGSQKTYFYFNLEYSNVVLFSKINMISE